MATGPLISAVTEGLDLIADPEPAQGTAFGKYFVSHGNRIRDGSFRGAFPPPARPALNFSPASGAAEKRVVSKEVSGRPEDRARRVAPDFALSWAVFSAS
ncbi:hypothetical protein DF3PB_590009 [uncultured Defluviicoccus sp.]|uniref:Uncharacterized protein n=1 Tax=metagenome TaxID=256318 RepID=A0A380TJF5_9ZZZZ|nr:hypothetical protein DF3PB_590009 [uncultured Defluviicoccus sp.]